MPKPKGTPLTPEQKEKMHAGLAAYHEAKKAGTWQPKPGKGKKAQKQQAAAEPVELEQESAPTLSETEAGDLLDQLPDSQIADLHHLAMQVIKDALTGMRVLVHTTDGLMPQLRRGHAALWEIDTQDGARWVYQYKPDVKLAQFVTQHTEGRAGTRDVTPKATTVIYHSALPGSDAVVDDYLRSLPDAVIEKLELPADILTKITAAKAG